MARFIRFATGAAAALVASAALGPPAALAHVELDSTTPKARSTVKASPPAVRMTFSGPIRRGSATVTGPGGATASSGKAGRDPRNIARLLVPLRPRLQSGRYTVKASVVAADGHRETFTFWFKIKK